MIHLHALWVLVTLINIFLKCSVFYSEFFLALCFPFSRFIFTLALPAVLLFFQIYCICVFLTNLSHHTQISKMWMKKGFMTVIQERYLPQTRMAHAQMHLIPVSTLLFFMFISISNIRIFFTSHIWHTLPLLTVSFAPVCTSVHPADMYDRCRSQSTRRRKWWTRSCKRRASSKSPSILWPPLGPSLRYEKHVTFVLLSAVFFLMNKWKQRFFLLLMCVLSNALVTFVCCVYVNVRMRLIITSMCFCWYFT